MPITYIVGPANSSKSTLLEAYRKEVPEGVKVVLVGSRGLPHTYFARAKRDAMSFFAEYPTSNTMRELLGHTTAGMRGALHGQLRYVSRLLGMPCPEMGAIGRTVEQPELPGL